jgi:hypothetical protein
MTYPKRSATPARFALDTAVGTVCAVLLVVMCAGASAQSTVKLRPGLWEQTIQMQNAGGQMENMMKEMQAALAKMPPAERKQMEEMMARQGVGLGDKGQTVKICMTQADVDREEPPPQPGCTHTAKRSGNTWQMSFRCAGPPPSTGEGSLVMQSPTAYSGNFKINSNQAGKAETMQMANAGKWISADCGNIRPVQQR